MSDTTYIDGIPPAVNAAWLNDVNRLTYYFCGSNGTPAANAAAVLSNLGGISLATANSLYVKLAGGNTIGGNNTFTSTNIFTGNNFFGTTGAAVQQKFYTGNPYIYGSSGVLAVEAHLANDGTGFTGASISAWGDGTGNSLGGYLIGFNDSFTAWGVNSIAYSGTPHVSPVHPTTLVGVEINVVSQYHGGGAPLIGVDNVFYDRPGGSSSTLHGSIGSDGYNDQTVAYRTTAQTQSSYLEKCWWGTGLQFVSGSIGPTNSQPIGRAIDFSQLSPTGTNATNCMTFADGTILNSAPSGKGVTPHHYGPSTNPARAAGVVYGPFPYSIKIRIICISTPTATVNDLFELVINTTGTFSGSEYGPDVAANNITFWPPLATPIANPNGTSIVWEVPAGCYYRLNTYGNCALASSNNAWLEQKPTSVS